MPDGANMDVLIAYRRHLRFEDKVAAYGPYLGDEAHWEWLSVPAWGWHIHRVPRRDEDGGGYAWLAYNTVESSLGRVTPERGSLVATAVTDAENLPQRWTPHPPPPASD